MVFYLYAKKYKKRLNGSKDSNLTLGVKEWKQRKNGLYQSESTFQEIFKYEIRFSKSLAVVSDIGV